MTNLLTNLQDKANDAFYAWERANNEQDLSDDDRMLWTAGWMEACKEKQIEIDNLKAELKYFYGGGK
jgi:hypothetical protein